MREHGQRDDERRLAIAIAARDLLGTGGGTVALESARGLARLGHRVALITDVPVEAMRPHVDGLELRVTRLGPRLRRWRARGKVARSLRHLALLLAFLVEGGRLMARARAQGEITIDHNAETGGGDVAVVHNVYRSQWMADRRRWHRRTPQLLNPTFWIRLARERIVLSNDRRMVVAVSPETAEEVHRALGRRRAITVIRSGVDTVRFHPAAANGTGVRDATDRRVIVFCGHEFERKRLDLVIEALALLPLDYYLHVAGGRFSTRAPYAAQAAQLGVADRVEFLDTVTNPAALYQGADVFVLPSDYETWGLVCMEALACGVPVVMTRVGCADEVIVAGETGAVVEPDAGSIAAAIRALTADAASLATIRHHARAMAERHAWPTVARAYESVALAAKARAHV
jgi:glycosyltransferase involved in cell wall biosynthesis